MHNKPFNPTPREDARRGLMAALGRECNRPRVPLAHMCPVSQPGHSPPDGLLLVYDLAPRRVVRVVLEFESTRRPLCWLEVGKDGSVYFGLSRATASLGAGMKAPEGDNAVSVLYKEANEVQDADVKRKLHISFHASGVINAAGQRSYRSSWRTLPGPNQLALMLFEHPSRYPTTSAVRKRDVVVACSVAEDEPLFGKLLVAHGGPSLIRLEGARSQVLLAFQVKDLTDVPPITVYLALGHGLKGSWPPRTIVSWSASPGGASGGAA